MVGLALDTPEVARADHTTVVDAERARAYAEATNDPNPAYRDGRHVPPVFAVVPAWPALRAVVDRLLTPQEMARLVHAEQDMHFSAPLLVGTEVTTTAEVHALRPAASSTRCTVRLVTREVGGDAVAVTQYVTLFLRGVRADSPHGHDKPEHRFPAGARDAVVGGRTVHVDDDQTYRYAAASGDDNPIHRDPQFARSVGLPGIILHGLCSMAMAGAAVLDLAGAGDPGRLRRLAVRFSDYVLPGDDLTVEVFDAGTDGNRQAYAFEAHSGGRRCLTHGRAEFAAG